jgi:Uma2 family endonuclease
MIAAPVDPAHVDQRVRLHDVTWQDYLRFLELRGESAAVRLTYLEGELEMMTPSLHHERHKKRLARLLEAYAEETGMQLEGCGSWTLKREETERGAEADECYVLGPRDPETLTAPDFAIEVVWTSGGIDKLAVYSGLGVREVWFWEAGELRFFGLRDGGYERVERSEVWPALDVELVVRFMTSDDDQTSAVRGLRKALRDRLG